jgi:hypothetical protein
MAETTKAIGIRIPLALWARIQEYGAEHHPKGDSFDVTQTLVTLLANALSIPLDDIVKRPTAPDDHVVQLVRQELDKALVNARIGTHTDITADGVQTAIERAMEQAIALIQNDLAELLLRVDRLESTATIGQKATSPKPKKEPRPSSDELPAEVLKVVDRLRREPDLLAAVKKTLSHGGTAAEIADRLLQSGHEAVNGGPHSSGAISRFKAAVTYLDEG